MTKDYSPASGKPATTSNAWTAERALAELGSELEGRAVDLEFSLRLEPGFVNARGRFGCWLGGRTEQDFQPIGRVLRRLDAPASVCAAQRLAENPVRQGIAVAFKGAAAEFRLYLHGRRPTTLADHYHAWRWLPGTAPLRSDYTFHFMPETPAGRRPIEFIPAHLHGPFARLLADERFQMSSGFWLREGAGGEIEQVDLTFPWSPRACTLPGLDELAELFRLPRERSSDWRELAIRHVAVRTGARSAAVTLYASAALDDSWPADEAALQRQVRCGALAFQRAAEDGLYRHVPAPAHGLADRGGIESFYDGEVETWRRVLGDKLHYHAGLFDTPRLEACGMEPDDAAMDTALERAVTELYPFIPPGGRIYDIGCGWGGALSMWARDMGCPSLGLTISGAQFRHVASLGLPVRRGDAEQTLPPGRFDCAVLLESFEHIYDKARLLRVLRLFAGRLVMRVNCQDASPPSAAFGGTMQMISSTRLRELLDASGWRIRHWRDRRREALPSVAVWHRRLRLLPPSADAHLETLRAWCARVMSAPHDWAHHNPLIEVMAD